jgi:hypothetical protein
MLTHESNRTRKLILEAEKIRLLGLVNQMVWFCQDQQQTRAPSGFDEELILQPNDVWTVERLEPCQP